MIVKRRPVLLSWLCIGSAISGIMYISMLLTLILTSTAGNVNSSIFPGMVIEYYKAGYLFVATLVVLASISLAGVYLMWKMKIEGFYIYSIIKIILYFLPVVYIGYNHLTFIGLAITSTFIVMYGVSIPTLHTSTLGKTKEIEKKNQKIN